MRWITLAVIVSVFLIGGCVTIVLEEQGNGKESELSVNEAGSNEPVPVRIVEEQGGDADDTQAPAAREDMQVPVLDTDHENTPDPDEPTPEENAYGDERLADLQEEARRRGDAVPLDNFDSHEMLEVLDLNVKKISPSRGSVEEILFVVRNFGDVPLHSRVEFLVETTITNPEFPRVERVEFDLDEILPGMKIEKRAYLNIEFRPLNYERKWDLRLLTRNYPPNEITAIGGRFRLKE